MHWDLQDLTLATSRILSRNNQLWKGAKPERLPRRIRRGSKIFWMMEMKEKSEGQTRREKAVARIRSNEPSRKNTKKLGHGMDTIQSKWKRSQENS